MPTVAPDYREVGHWVANHLLARGLRRFAYVGVMQASRAAKDHRAGFAGVARKARLPMKVIPVPGRFAGTASGWEAFQAMMEAWIPRQMWPAGIFCNRDMLARYVVNALARHCVGVPQEAAVVGDGNEELVCTHPEPSLTSVEGGSKRSATRIGI